MTQATAREVKGGAELNAKAFRNALGSFPTGVAIITTLGPNGEPVGLTCNSFSSVSLDPPLVAWSLRLASKSIDVFRAAAGFAINMLHDDQVELSARFASSTNATKFDGVRHTPGHLGSPRIEGCVADFQCETFAQHVAGDHLIFIGQVRAFEHTVQAPSLVFYRGGYMALTQSLRELSLDGRISPQQLEAARERLHELLLRLACEQGRDEDFDAIEHNIAQMEAYASDDAARRSANAREFFDLIARAARNEVLSVVAGSLTTLLHHTLTTRLPRVARPELLPVRRRILACMRARDADASVAAMNAYFDAFREVLRADTPLPILPPTI
ncbi:MAG: flavin reductase [Variovorax sp.]|nr:flavin reductase [Variovorax sp.]